MVLVFLMNMLKSRMIKLKVERWMRERERLRAHVIRKSRMINREGDEML